MCVQLPAKSIFEFFTLNPPEKESLTSRSLKAQTADPPMELGGVLNVAYKMASLVFASSLTLKNEIEKYIKYLNI